MQNISELESNQSGFDSIFLSNDNNEVDIIYNTIKKDWRALLHNPNQVFTDLRNKVSQNTYNNIIYFYNLYSKKISLL